jgi:hypothetical protein
MFPPKDDGHIQITKRNILQFLTKPAFLLALPTWRYLPQEYLAKKKSQWYLIVKSVKSQTTIWGLNE